MTPETLLAAAYDAFNSRNLDAALALMDPAVEWPNGMEGGSVHGRDGVREYWTRQWSLIDPRVEPIAITCDSDGRYRVEVHQIVQELSGAVVADRMVQHIYTLRNGLIAAMEIQE